MQLYSFHVLTVMIIFILQGIFYQVRKNIADYPCDWQSLNQSYTLFRCSLYREKSYTKLWQVGDRIFCDLEG